MIAMFSILSFCMASVLVHAEETPVYIDEPIFPIPLQVKLNANKVLLGEALFNDARLSKDNDISCATCHQLDQGGDDNMAFSVTANDKKQVVNTPTIFNVSNNFRQNWNSSAENLSDHLDKLISNQSEIDSSWQYLLDKLNTDDALVHSFSTVYSAGITKETYQDALTEFERSLITPNSKFDRYLRGESQAISTEEKEGYVLFKEYGCISCHQGVNVGGNLFQKFGIFYNYFEKRGDISNADYGRKNITGREIDSHVFKVPSLRNIALTSPYFHDGATESLKDAILLMGKTQLGISISGHDINKIEMFLNTLTGEYKGRSLAGDDS